MPQIEIECPSGLKGVVRGLTGAEIDLFANKQEVQRRNVSRRVLQNCWVETSDWGPLYSRAFDDAKRNAKIRMDDVLTCDRFYALLQIRVATHGENYDFSVQCSNPTCRKKYDWRININEDLDVYELPEESIETYVNGNRFRVDVMGNDVTFKLQTGADENTTIKAYDLAPDQQATTSVVQRVVSVLMPNGELASDGNDIRQWARQLSYEKTMALVDSMDRADGGVQTNFEVQCSHCGHLEEIELPLGSDFWTPKRRRTTEGRKVRRRNRGSRPS